MNFSEFGKEISKQRKIKKISQTQLSQDLNISRATISSFENGGIVDIGFKKVLQIAEYLELEFKLSDKSNFPVFEDILNDK